VNGSTTRLSGKHGRRELKHMTVASLRCSSPAMAALIPPIFAAPTQMQRETSSSSLPDAAAEDEANQVAAISSPVAPLRKQSAIAPPVRHFELHLSDVMAAAGVMLSCGMLDQSSYFRSRPHRCKTLKFDPCTNSVPCEKPPSGAGQSRSMAPRKDQDRSRSPRRRRRSGGS